MKPKRKMNQILVLLLSLSLVMNSFSKVNANGNYQVNLDEMYEDIYNQYQLQNQRRRSVAPTLSKENLVELQKQEVDPIFYDFFTIFSSYNFEDLYYTDSAKIIVNKELNTPILIKVQNEELHIQIGNKKYVMETKEEELNKWVLLSISGKTMVLYSEVYENQNIDIPLKDEYRLESRSGAYWMAESGGIKGETGMWLKVLAYVTWAGSSPLIQASSSVGIIIWLVSGAVAIGTNMYVTMYTIKYQSQRSDCRTYIRERTDYYQYNNYTGFLKTDYYYFHAERPDYAGGACMGYY